MLYLEKIHDSSYYYGNSSIIYCNEQLFRSDDVVQGEPVLPAEHAAQDDQARGVRPQIPQGGARHPGEVS
jgi:hypothetical protein